MIDVCKRKDSIQFGVRVLPRASRSEIVGEYDGALKVRLAAPPVDGKANKELVAILASFFRVVKGTVSIRSGESSNNKRVQIAGLDLEGFNAAIDRSNCE